MKNTISKLHLENVSVKNILSNINLTFYSNKIYSIFGKSGVGKSTLIRAISGNIECEGEIFLNDSNLSNIKPEKHRVLLNYLPQEPVLLGKTPKDDFRILKSLKIHKDFEFKESELKYMLEKLQLSEDILDKNINVLSGGEKQRLALIRSALLKPKFILLDEPTSALDVFTEEIVFKFLKTLLGEIGIIIVSHSERIIKGSDTKIFIDINGIDIFENDIDDDFIFNIIKDKNES